MSPDDATLFLYGPRKPKLTSSSTSGAVLSIESPLEARSWRSCLTTSRDPARARAEPAIASRQKTRYDYFPLMTINSLSRLMGLISFGERDDDAGSRTAAGALFLITSLR